MKTLSTWGGACKAVIFNTKVKVRRAVARANQNGSNRCYDRRYNISAMELKMLPAQ
jgi:hypothetical protein